MVWGPPKCGKTFAVLDLVMHVALGWEYRGRRVTPGAVLYVACEGERGLAARVEAFRRDRLQESPDPVPFYLLASRLDLAADHGQLIADLRAQLGGVQPAAIVIDTLNRSLRGSESSDEDMAAYVAGADALREAFNCAVVVIHHCGIDDKRPRGHTSLTGAADAQIKVVRDAADQVVMTVEYMKDGPDGDEIVSRLRAVEVCVDQDGESSTSCVVDPADGKAAGSDRTPKLSAGAKLALDSLRKCTAEMGQPAPASDHVPNWVRGVTKAQWRHMLECDGVINPDGNPREQLRRFLVTLKSAGVIGAWNDFVWIVTRRHNGVT